jgi:hypothetical protein
MKLRKFKILFFVLTLTSLNSIAFSQINADSVILKSISLKIESLKKTEATVLNEAEKFRAVSKNFCFLQENDKDLADVLFNIGLRSNFIPKKITYSFFIKQYNCFNEKQISAVVRMLKNELEPEAPNFFELVSLYGLSNYNDFLKNNLVSSDLKKALEIDLYSQRRLSKNATLELKSMATLSNLGNLELEEKLINIILSIWKNKGEHPNWNPRVFYDIFYSSVPLLLSKRSVLETIFMLDQPSNKNVSGSSDITNIEPGFYYFLTCIQPKLNTNKLEILGWMDFEKNKNQIRNAIIEDDSIWQNHIR